MPDAVAVSHGIKVPQSHFLNEQRIERINNSRYEWQEIEGSLAMLKPDDRVLELGSGIGLVGAILASRLTDGKVLSFEANPDLIPAIQALYELNRLKNISARNQVVWAGPNQPADALFRISGSYLGSTLLTPVAKTRKEVSIPTISWSEVMLDFKPTMLVMDIEGSEAQVIEHADFSSIQRIVVELHPKNYGIDTMRACRNRLMEMGYARLNSLSSRTIFVGERV